MIDKDQKPAGDLDDAALYFHRYPRPGKLEIRPTKPLGNQRDLALAYSPGVAAPCRAIAADPSKAFEYTARGNLVAVVSNGTAVLGLGAIGPLAAKPVMEGKAVLFKKFAGIDVFDIEIDALEIDRVVEVVAALEPTFGGINLEDIRGPDCFEIERRLRDRMKIPVFHDDQHGTAIIVGAAVTNALGIAGKRFEDVKVVASGAGAAGIACLNLLVSLGVRRENVWVTDIAGVVYAGRTELMDPWKGVYAQETDKRTLAEVIEGADVFLGVSAAGVLKPEMVARMAPEPARARARQPQSGDLARRRPRGAPGRDDLHRPFGLSEPGQQRPLLPLRLPRRPRRRCDDDQRGDEARRRARHRRPRQGGALRRRRPRLQRHRLDLRPDLPDPDPVRSAPHPAHRPGGRARGDGDRGGDAADRRLRRLSRHPRPLRLPLRPRHEADLHRRPLEPRPHRPRRWRGRAGAPRGAGRGRGRHRPADPSSADRR